MCDMSLDILIYKKINKYMIFVGVEFNGFAHRYNLFWLGVQQI